MVNLLTFGHKKRAYPRFARIGQMQGDIPGDFDAEVGMRMSKMNRRRARAIPSFAPTVLDK
jgi:hypothetical protein